MDGSLLERGMSERTLAAPWGDEEVMSALRAQMRLIAREEVASLCGLVLRRLQEHGLKDGTSEPTAAALRRAFGEALRDFGGTEEEPGSVA